MPTNLKFKSVAKDRLFYNRFQYCIGFHLAEATCLRKLDHDKIDEMLEHRKQWRKNAQSRWAGFQANELTNRWQDITEKTATDLHSLSTVLLNTTAEFKLVINFNQGYVYTNVKSLISQLKNMTELSNITLTQALINRPANTIKLKKSQHQYRGYFQELRLSAQEKKTLANFLQTQADFVRLSPSTREWTSMPSSRLHGYFFVDYDSSLWLTMINLVCPGVIRKTVQIIVDK